MSATATKNEKDVPQTKQYFCTQTGPWGMDKIVWDWVWLGTAHGFGFYGFYLCLINQLPATMLLFALSFGYFAGFGTTIGCHRLWTHKTFKAKLPLQILLAYMQTTAAQYSIFKWCRDHRIHHKYVETDADPHDARRGFWFAHIGWLFSKEHPTVQEKEATIDFSDLDEDPVVRFQNKYYFYLLTICVFIVPMTIQHLMWPEVTLFPLFCQNYVWYLFSLHFTFLVNSAAHLWGPRPYDGSIHARENRIVAILAIGEGYHNYHHVFPWDYKAAELGLYSFNASTILINFFAWIGWAYDLKTVPQKIVEDRVRRTGDGSYNQYHGFGGDDELRVDVGSLKDQKDTDSKDALPAWGWGDKDIPLDQFEITSILKPLKSG